MFAKLDEVEKKYEQLQNSAQRPDLANNPKEFRTVMKEMASLEEVVLSYRRYKSLKHQHATSIEMLEQEKDSEMRQLIKAEIDELDPQIENLIAELKILLLPKDPNDDRNIFLELRAGAGGDESSLFTEELFRAYSHYASAKGWKVDVVSISPGNSGGYKEVIANIRGEKVYSLLKYESGVHRVQRVPKTEASGRIHTSTITVAVIPEMDEVEIKVNPNDLRVDVMRASGAGGQHINTTDSAVRLTHIPTGVVVYCQDGRSQHANRDKAMKILLSRLQQMEDDRVIREASEARLSQIGTGDRSERIRTYNFPQSRITDHRIGLTIHSINEVMNGAIDPLVEPLVTYFQAEGLKSQNL